MNTFEPKSLSQRFDELLGHCRNNPDGPALCIDQLVMSFGRLGARIQAIYDALEEMPDGPVLIHGHKDLDIIPAMAAATFAGRGFVFAEIVYPQLRIDQIVDTCGVQTVIRTNEKAMPQKLATIDTSDLADKPLGGLRCSCDDEDKLFYITFTSGSTGAPKGIPTRRSCFATLQNWFEPQNTCSKGGTGAHVNHASMAFDMSMSDIWTALFAGRALFLIDHAHTLKPRRIINSLTSQPDVPVGTFTATPAFYSLMMGDPKFSAQTLPDLKSFWIGGDTVPQSVLQEIMARFPDAEIYCAYGPSEATCVTHSKLLTKDDIEGSGTLDLGPPKPGNAAMVTTSKGLQSHGRGEIILIGDQVAETYLPVSHPNNQSFFTEQGRNAFSTGDIGEIDTQGRLKILGRADNQVKVNGHRIELDEIERIALQVTGVKFAIAQLSDAMGKRELILTITPEATRADLTDVTRTHLLNTLPPYMVPQQIVTQDCMPLTTAGKVDRKKLADIRLSNESRLN